MPFDPEGYYYEPAALPGTSPDYTATGVPSYGEPGYTGAVINPGYSPYVPIDNTGIYNPTPSATINAGYPPYVPIENTGIPVSPALPFVGGDVPALPAQPAYGGYDPNVPVASALPVGGGGGQPATDQWSGWRNFVANAFPNVGGNAPFLGGVASPMNWGLSVGGAGSGGGWGAPVTGWGSRLLQEGGVVRRAVPLSDQEYYDQMYQDLLRKRDRAYRSVPGSRFDPADVPILPDPRSGNLFYNPYLGSRDLLYKAQGGGVVPNYGSGIPGVVMSQYGYPVPVTVQMRGPKYDVPEKPTAGEELQRGISGAGQRIAGGINQYQYNQLYNQPYNYLNQYSNPYSPSYVPITNTGYVAAQFGGIIPSLPPMPMLPGYGGPASGMETVASFQRRKPQRSTDTVPAMLTPGEMVLTRPQQAAVRPIPGRARSLRPDQRAAFRTARGRRSY